MTHMAWLERPGAAQQAANQSAWRSPATQHLLSRAVPQDLDGAVKGQDALEKIRGGGARGGYLGSCLAFQLPQPEEGTVKMGLCLPRVLTSCLCQPSGQWWA